MNNKIFVFAMIEKKIENIKLFKNLLPRKKMSCCHVKRCKIQSENQISNPPFNGPLVTVSSNDSVVEAIADQ